MRNIIKLKEATSLSRILKKQGKKIVLVGGCFDILHTGHIIFLEKAKIAGDILIVLLESDQKVKKTKGGERPINTQKTRAKILSSLRFIDYVISLPFMEDEKDYDKLIIEIKPDIIATTRGDVNIEHKKRTAKKVRATLKYVTGIVKDQSTSNLLKLLGYF